MAASGMTIEVASIPPEGVEREWERGAEELDLDPEVIRLPGPATVHVTARRNGQEVHVRGTVQARVAQTCGRCLEEFERDDELALEVVYLASEEGREADRIPAGQDANVSLAWYDGVRIDLRSEVRDLLMLSGPMFPLCRDDCRGLCPRCGANLNDGPCGCKAEPPTSPFAALSSLKEQLTADETAEKQKGE